jgi:hypothetical protein
VRPDAVADLDAAMRADRKQYLAQIREQATNPAERGPNAAVKDSQHHDQQPATHQSGLPP